MLTFKKKGGGVFLKNHTEKSFLRSSLLHNKQYDLWEITWKSSTPQKQDAFLYISLQHKIPYIIFLLPLHKETT